MIKLPEPVLYQYRWTNPGGGEQPASMLEWEDVEPAWSQTVAQKCDEFLAYRYKGEPIYEVRALVPETQLKQAVRDAVEACARVADCRDLPATSAAIRALIKEIPE